MQPDNHLILIITDDGDAARHLKELLEFMDAPLVECATLANWQSHLGPQRLSAVFLGPGLDDKTSGTIIGEIGNFDPNVSIVILGANPESPGPQ